VRIASEAIALEGELAGAVTNVESVDILIVGSGMGGATCAAGLAPSGGVLILEPGARLRDSRDACDPRAIFQRGVPSPSLARHGADRQLRPNCRSPD